MTTMAAAISAIVILAPAAATAAPRTPAVAFASPTLLPASAKGEVGEANEAGVDAVRAKDEPVAYLVGLEVIAAHYHAGRAAYAAGRHEEGAEMFAHGISEAYVDLEPVFQARGVADFKALMEKAVERASAKAPAAEVTAATDAVLAALTEAETHAPASSLPPAEVQRQTLAELMNRAVQNYMAAARGTDRDAYLDGYGYRIGAEARAARLVAAAPQAAAKLQTAIALIAKAYASIDAPALGAVSPGDLSAAVSSAQLALGSS